MNKEKLFKVLSIAVLCLFAMSSCSSYYYQILNTQTVGDLKQENNIVFYEDANCKINYDLWENGGTTIIRFENKTNEDIYLELSSSFFFMNDQAYNLSGTSKPSHNGSQEWGCGFKTCLNTKEVSQNRITIPAKMYKIIGETDISILETIYKDCNLDIRPTKENVKSSTFTQDDSPYKFGLRLCYYIGNNEVPLKIRNEFYVDKITNCIRKQFKTYEFVTTKECPNSDEKERYTAKYPFTAPNVFYLKYYPDKIE